MKGILLALVFLSTTSLAWWEVGHMLTAQVAELHLKQNNPEVLAWAECLIQDFADLTDGRSNTFVEAAVWADDIKEPGMNFYDNFHFTDRPVNPKGLLITIDPVEIKYNSIDIVKRARSVLTNPKTLHLDHTWAKAQMIRYLIHVIGDMHQPLHNSNFYNETYSKGDQGGNFINIKKLDGTKVNLHAYWDAGAAVLQPNDDLLVRPLNESAFKYTHEWAAKAMSTHPISEFGGRNMSDPVKWTSEGYQDAIDYVYPFLQNTAEITEEYQRQAYQVIERSIALGGYRLANYLTEIYQQNEAKKAEASFVESRLSKISAQKFRY